ncbi:MAG TPA: hypothetical protein VEK08_24085 [Planctomycetota bacterium]|nr:hypothetical protein [Planctomycetota bacterium]
MLRFIFFIFLIGSGVLGYILVMHGVAAFLQALGIAFVLFIAAIVLGLVMLKMFFKKLADSLGSMSASMTPRRIKLSQIDQTQWEDKAAVEKFARELTSLGFNKISDFEIDPMPMVKMSAFTHAAQAVYGVIYEVKPVGVWIDLVSRVREGDKLHRISYTNSSNPQIGLMDMPPDCISVKRSDLGTCDLFNLLISQRPKGEVEATPAEKFTECFESAWAYERDWRNARGGPTKDEVRRVARLNGGEVTEEAIEMTHEQQTLEALEQLDETLREKFLEGKRLHSDAELVIIHDKLRVKDMQSKIEPYSHSDKGEEEEVAGDEPEPTVFPDGTPRQAFSAFNEKLPAEKKYKLLGTVDHPLPADVYEPPRAA